MDWKAFWRGFGSVFNIWGNRRIDDLYIKSYKEAMASDWRAIGNDMKKAMEKFR